VDATVPADSDSIMSSVVNLRNLRNLWMDRCRRAYAGRALFSASNIATMFCGGTSAWMLWTDAGM
jgi:hypothetical protein